MLLAAASIDWTDSRIAPKWIKTSAGVASSRPDDDLYDAKVKVLGEDIDHHVAEENANSRRCLDDDFTRGTFIYGSAAVILALSSTRTHSMGHVCRRHSRIGGRRSGVQGGGVSFEREIDSGDPAPTLLEIAARQRCNAIIMGTRGRGSLRSALLGSVSQALLHASPVPVTIVKHVAAEVGDGETVRS